MVKVVCQYCKTVNEAGADTCLACGGPLPPVSLPSTDAPEGEPMAYIPAFESTVRPSTFETNDLRLAGEKVERVYASALNVYAIVWRTLGETVSIALTGFLLGLIGGATGRGAGGIAGGVIVGGAVGLTDKIVWLAALSAPLGALLGCLLWGMAMAFGAGAGGMVYTALVFAVLLAVVGGRKTRKTWWDRLRPFLGMGGGLIAALVGLALGLLLREAAGALLGGL